MAKELVKCPRCGSTFIKINGLLQEVKNGKAKGNGFYGTFFKLGYKAASKKDAPNAVCLSCKHTWRQ